MRVRDLERTGLPAPRAKAYYAGEYTLLEGAAMFALHRLALCP